MNRRVGVARNIEGFSKVYRVLFGGVTPSSIAAQYVEMLKSSTVIDNDCEKGSST